MMGCLLLIGLLILLGAGAAAMTSGMWAALGIIFIVIALIGAALARDA